MRTILTIMTFVAFTGAAYAADAKAGEAAYMKSCKSCHGTDGTHNPGIAKMMKVEMKDLGSPEVQAMSDADIKKWITVGMGKMKPVPAAAASADDIAAYVKTLKK
jgi:mono/diheme cytochrome c family protein